MEATGKLLFREYKRKPWDWKRYMTRGYKAKKPCKGWYKPSTCILILLILLTLSYAITVCVLFLPQYNTHIENVYRKGMQLPSVCSDSCRLELVETIPEELTLHSSVVVSHESTYEGWLRLLELAQEKFEIVSFYWNLVDPGMPPEVTREGRDIYQKLFEAGTKRNISIKIAQNSESKQHPNLDTKYLVDAKAAEVRSLDFNKLLGGGVLHTKMWVVDRKHFYIGSANFYWKSLSKVKELGVLVTNCSCLGEDLGKIFDSNPSPFSPDGRTSDLDAITDVIQNAAEFIHIAVMDYSPSILYTQPPRFWPEIDNALRQVAMDKGVQIRLLISKRDNTKNSTYKFLRSLQHLNNVYTHVKIEVKLFEFPSSTPSQKQSQFTKYNHNKYMLTDKSVFIGSSNWSGDYFNNTAGVGIVITSRASNPKDDIRKQLSQIFERDWNSAYAKYLID